MTRDTHAFWRQLRARVEEARTAPLSPDQAEARMACADEIPLSGDTIDEILMRVTGAPAVSSAAKPPTKKAHEPTVSAPPARTTVARRRGTLWKIAAMIVAGVAFLGISSGVLPDLLWPEQRNSSQTMPFEEAVEILVDSSQPMNKRSAAHLRVYQGTKYCIQALQRVALDDVGLGNSAARHLDELRRLLAKPVPYQYTSADASILQLVNRLQNPAFPPAQRRMALEQVAAQARHGLLALLDVRGSRDAPELVAGAEVYCAKLAALLAQ